PRGVRGRRIHAVMAGPSTGEDDSRWLLGGVRGDRGPGRPARDGGAAGGNGGGSAELFRRPARKAGLRGEAAPRAGHREWTGGGDDQAAGERAHETQRGTLAAGARRPLRGTAGTGRHSRMG